MYLSNNKLQVFDQENSLAHQRKLYDNLIVTIISQLSPTELQIINSIGLTLIKFGNCERSQRSIGDDADIVRESCNRILEDLCARGIVSKQYRYFDVCFYQLPKNLFTAKVARALRYFLPFLNLVLSSKYRCLRETSHLYYIVPIFVGDFDEKCPFPSKKYLRVRYGEHPPDLLEAF